MTGTAPAFTNTVVALTNTPLPATGGNYVWSRSGNVFTFSTSSLSTTADTVANKHIAMGLGD